MTKQKHESSPQIARKQLVKTQLVKRRGINMAKIKTLVEQLNSRNKKS